MKIIGIDPGTGRLGFGVIGVKGDKQTMIDAGVITTPVNSPQPERLLTIYENLREIVAAAKPDEMAVEKLYFSQNVTTAMAVSQARGIVLLIGQQFGLTIHEYTPQQIKQSLTGYGKADKKQVQEMVRVCLNLTETPKPDDCADALAAAVTHSLYIKNIRG